MNKPKINKNFSTPNCMEEMFLGATNETGILVTVNSGFRNFHPIFKNEDCIHCNLCWIYCPEGAIEKESGEMKVDMDYCKGCGICSNECPSKCISMVKDGE